MQTTDTTSFLAPGPVKVNWEFLEAWIDPMQSPPYLLLLLGDSTNGCYVFDPAESYGLVKAFQRYEDAQLWLLEDEYEPLNGRLSSSEVH
ncbi:hypothetical protein [Stenomitos frigidus]|uniref:Uncharacterized protein n=1 Tax=Stenomitos frigidus ULC18 TaxID=2107698 RepID=A0A2T1E2C4_9CYAN|nr:hypothetical protein [Stenomitos frigidus]PSB26887.1 hypothetical protein C7B82_18785 [Stenomitos frigidus ULC18]